MAFQQVKPQCVALLRHIKLSDTRNLQALPGLLDSLERTLKTLEQPTSRHNGISSLSLQQQQEQKKQAHQLANYVFFPFSQFLQVNTIQILRSSPAHQYVFNAFLRVLGTLIRTLDFEKAILEQLWTFTGLTLGGPLGAKAFELGWNDAVRRRLVEIWSTILAKVHEHGPNNELVLPAPIVAHTLNTVLLLLEDKDTEQDTRITCLEFLDSFIEIHLREEDKVPQYLPGIVSTLAKVILAQSKSGKIVVAALKPLSHAIQASINETRCEALGLYETVETTTDSHITSLLDIFSKDSAQRVSKVADGTSQGRGPFSGPNGGQSADTLSETDLSASQMQAEPGASRAWLKATASQLQRAILSILPILRSHQNPETRQALAQFCYTQLDSCFQSLLTTTSRLLLEELLVSSKDAWDQVSTTASLGLQTLINRPSESSSGQPNCSALVSAIAQESIISLPHSIFTNGTAHEETLQRTLNLIIASLESRPSLSVKHLKLERWSLNLLRAVEFAPIASGSARPRDETSAWTRTDPSSLLLMDQIDQPATKFIEPVDTLHTGSQKHIPPFPALRLANVAPGSTSALLQKTLKSFHNLAGLSGLLEHFIGIAGFADSGMPVGGTSIVASALWVVQQILDGLAEASVADPSKICNRILSEVPDIALSWLNRDDLEDLEENVRSSHSNDRVDRREGEEEADDIGPPEFHTSALSLTGILDEKASRALHKPVKSARRVTYELQVHCMCLRLLAVSARLLRHDFQRYMMHVLYPVLRALCPSSETHLGTLQAHAYCTLHQMATYLGYETPSQMLIANVDYILNSISAHLRGTTTLSNGALDPLAPSVLVSVIELAGEDILPYLGDAVDEIFDALDRWQAYDLLVSELLRVLDRLVNVCRIDAPRVPTTVNPAGRAIEQVAKMQPDPEKDLQTFEDWFMSRHDDRLRYKSEVQHELASDIDKLPGNNPEMPFQTLLGNDGRPAEGKEDEDDGAIPTDQTESEEKETPLTKTQALVLAILRKSMYYLSHSSAFLRARVLALISSSIPVLADRTSDFFPEIHRFWPYILARLDDGFERSPAFVLLEVMQLLNTLMTYRGDFMNRRILKDVLPRLRTLVQRHNFVPTTKNQFTNEYRTLRVILELVTVALRDVPGVSGQDLWTISVLFRPFLASSVDADMRHEACKLYEALAQLDADLVWLVLSSGMGLVDDMSVFAMTAWSTYEPDVCRLLDAL